MKNTICTILCALAALAFLAQAAKNGKVTESKETQPSGLSQNDVQKEQATPPALANIFLKSGTLDKANKFVKDAETELAAKATQEIEALYAKYNLADMLVKRALLHEKAEQFELAETDFATAVSLHPVEALRHRAQYYERRGDIKKAGDDWEAAVKLGFGGHSNDAYEFCQEENLIGQARFYESVEKFEAAKECWDALVPLSKSDSAMALRGRFFERWKLHSPSTAPKFDWSEDLKRYDLAEFWERQGNLAKAKIQFEGARSMDYDITDNLEQFNERQGKMDLAEPSIFENYEDSRGLNTRHSRASFFERHGRYKEALKEIDECLLCSNNPDKAQDALIKVRLLAALGEKSKARDLAEQQLASRNDGMTALTQAQLSLALGRPTEAICVLACLEVNDDPWTSFTYGVALERAGFVTQAKEQLKRCLGLYTCDPTKSTSIDDSLCANSAAKQLAVLGVNSKLATPGYLKQMSYVPLAVMELK